MSKSCSPTVRALDELKRRYEMQCDAIDASERSANETALNEKKKEFRKDAISKVNAAIDALGIPYSRVHKDSCNVVQYDGTLRFELVFNPQAKPATKALASKNAAITKKRKEAKERLETWYVDSLYKIASREPIERFEI